MKVTDHQQGLAAPGRSCPLHYCYRPEVFACDAPPALQPFIGRERRYGVRQRGVHVDAIAINSDAAEVQRRFVALWPAGSDAHASYFRRITAGPDHAPGDVVRRDD